MTIVLGYKRTEAVLNPVYDSEGIGEGGPKYRKEAYSVIAKFIGEIGAGSGGDGAEGSIQASQWFATGEAANRVAANEGVAAALTDGHANSAPGGAGALYDSDSYFNVADQLDAIVATLGAWPNDPVAVGHLAALDALAQALPGSYPFIFYADDPTKPVATSVQHQIGDPVGATDFDDVTTYLEQLATSINVLGVYGAPAGSGTSEEQQVAERERIGALSAKTVLEAIQYAAKKIEQLQDGAK